MKPVIFLVILIPLFVNMNAQNHDYTWLFGYGYGPNGTPPHSDARIDFKSDPPTTGLDPKYLKLDACSAIMSDVEGNLLFYTNCKQIASFDHQLMENGTGLNPDDYYDYTGSNFSLSPQGAVAFPVPDKEGLYYLVHSATKLFPDVSDFYDFGFFYSVVDMNENSGLGKVIIKNEPLILDTLWTGNITTIKHANGRDWWILTSEYQTKEFYTLLADPFGISVVDTQSVETTLINGLGQSVFSPDGSKYVAYNAGDVVLYGQHLYIYDFDRCTGLLSNEVHINTLDTNFAAGCAISPNSRFLYVSAYTKLYQYDLWSEDIPASEVTVGEYDGYVSPFATLFYQAQLAPDGKIYLSSPSGVDVLHVIENPDEKGLACNFRQHGFALPIYNGFSLPNFPNYRLGPLDGSPCDTFGLDNMPIAKYRYEQDINNYLQVEFTDLSYYEPAEWSWDFGDNTTSQDASPVHVFPQDGVYDVCLTVSNANGEHTFCRTLELGTVSSSEEAKLANINIFPNPCREGVNVILSDYLPRDAKIVLYNAVGQQHKVQAVQTGWNTLRLDGLQAGIYFYEIREADVLLDSGKLVKVD